MDRHFKARLEARFAAQLTGPMGPFGRHNGLTVFDRVSLIDTFLYWSASFSYRLLGIIGHHQLGRRGMSVFVGSREFGRDEHGDDQQLR